METIPSRLPLLDTRPRAAVRHSPSEPYSEDPDALRIERTLAIVRWPIAILGLIAIWIYPAELPRLTAVATGTLATYFGFAAVLNLYLSRTSPLPVRLPMVLHATDIGVSAALTMFLGVGSPILVFLIYPVLAGAYRWGVCGALLTTVVMEAIFLMDALAPTARGPFVASGAEANTIALHALSLAVIGCLAGYLVRAHKQHQLEAIDLPALLRSARSRGEFDGTIALMLDAFVKMFRASTVMLVIGDRKTGGTFLWRAQARVDGPAESDELELRPEQREDYFFDLGNATLCEVTGPRRSACSFDAMGQRIEAGRKPRIPKAFLATHPFDRMSCVVLKSTNAWAGRLYVLDPGRRFGWNATARYVLRVCSELEPASRGLYGVHHLRARAQAIERSRIARDLHDGVTQSMLGVEMMVAVLRRRTLHEAPALNQDLLRIHDLIRENIIGLREVTESGHLVETMSGDLLADLQEIVDRFQRHSGIQAKFVSDRRNVSLTLHRHAEAARLVHEALVNVRKHSGAHRVIVRSSVADGCWTISIEDDGRGFPFGGRKTQAELDAHREGPRTVMERARRLGAEVAVESRPGCGSRVAIALRLAVE